MAVPLRHPFCLPPGRPPLGLPFFCGQSPCLSAASPQGFPQEQFLPPLSPHYVTEPMASSVSQNAACGPLSTGDTQNSVLGQAPALTD